MHLHSILWFAAAMMGIAVLYRRIASIGHSDLPDHAAIAGPAWIGGVAALMYLLDDNSYFPTMWLANRNLLISVFFGTLTLIAYDRLRRQEWRPGIVLAPLSLLISVLATEGGIATFAYLFAYEVALGQGRILRRFLSLVPFVAVIVLWRFVYNLQGYGASGGGFYFDPVREPLDYAVAVLLRGPFFVAGQWTSISADLHNYLPPQSKTLLWGFLAAVTVLVPVALMPLPASEPAGEILADRHVSLVYCPSVRRFRWAGPCSSIGIGAFGAVAEFIGGLAGEGPVDPRSRLGTACMRNAFCGVFRRPSAPGGRRTARGAARDRDSPRKTGRDPRSEAGRAIDGSGFGGGECAEPGSLSI